jgi:hypothetical protein
MRRVLLTATSFLLLSSCLYRPVVVGEGRTVIQGGLGSTPPPAIHKNRAEVCREISRSQCDVERCKGALDLVTLQCSGRQLTRCEVGKGCN